MPGLQPAFAPENLITLPHLIGVVSYDLGEAGGSAGKDSAAQVGEPHLPGRIETNPLACLETQQQFANSRDIRQRL